MDASVRARIARELPQGGWTPENHGKLVDFLATHGPGTLAMFDADNTTWAGDLGDSVLVSLLRNLSLSPRLHEVLPDAVDVPARSFGVEAGGTLFAAARVRDALGAMTEAYRVKVARRIIRSAIAADPGGWGTFCGTGSRLRHPGPWPGPWPARGRPGRPSAARE
jgi:hypothetical protein